MQKVQHLKDNYQKVLASKKPTKIKKALLQGILQQLKHLQRNAKPIELELNSCIKTDRASTVFTSVSFLSLNSTFQEKSYYDVEPVDVEHTSKQELELKILEKQRIKWFLNDQIQNLEDDYFQLQKIMFSKIDLTEQLQRKIARKTYEIGKKSCLRSKTQMQDEKKSLTSRFRHFFHM